MLFTPPQKGRPSAKINNTSNNAAGHENKSSAIGMRSGKRQRIDSEFSGETLSPPQPRRKSARLAGGSSEHNKQANLQVGLNSDPIDFLSTPPRKRTQLIVREPSSSRSPSIDGYHNASAPLMGEIVPLPKRHHNGTLYFRDEPLFTPNLTPEEILREGSFGGTAFKCVSWMRKPPFLALTSILLDFVRASYPDLITPPCFKSTYHQLTTTSSRLPGTQTSMSRHTSLPLNISHLRTSTVLKQGKVYPNGRKQDGLMLRTPEGGFNGTVVFIWEEERRMIKDRLRDVSELKQQL